MRNVITLFVLAAIAILGSCRSDSAPDTDTHCGSQSASTSLSGTLQGKVVSPSGPTIAAASAGSASVGDDGSASYRIPIWVPDGVRGMQPSLAITYNSKGGPGFLGPRWN